MLNLKNVRREDDWILADYVPEDWDEIGSIAVNVNNLDDYKIIKSKSDYEFCSYATDALNAVRRMATGEEELSDKMVMTY